MAKIQKLTATERKIAAIADAETARQTSVANETRDRLAKLRTFVNLDTLPRTTSSDVAYACRSLLSEARHAQERCVKEAEQLQKRCAEVVTRVTRGGTAFFSNPMDSDDATSYYATYLTLRRHTPDMLYACGFYTLTIASMLSVAAEVETGRALDVVQVTVDTWKVTVDGVWQATDIYASANEAWIALQELWNTRIAARRTELVTLFEATANAVATT